VETEDRSPIPNPADTALFRGDLVRLAAWDPEADAATVARWHEDPAFVRFGMDQPALPQNAAEAREMLERFVKGLPESVNLSVRAVADDALVGLVRLYDIQWMHGTAILGVSIGPDNWGRGLGTEASALILKYGFDELGLHRIWLDVFGYNERAIHVYRKLGFVEEGTLRQHLQRDGRRWDVILMGLLRDEFRWPENRPA
jgi:RimJ/RimL family protein N-acetyltransferase